MESVSKTADNAQLRTKTNDCRRKWMIFSKTTPHRPDPTDKLKMVVWKVKKCAVWLQIFIVRKYMDAIHDIPILSGKIVERVASVTLWIS